MQRTRHARLRSEEAVVQKLAEDLRTETSPAAIVGCIKALCKRLDDEARADYVALVFIRAGGLPALIRHLGGFATSAPTADPEATARVRQEAAEALRALMGGTQDMEIMAELRAARGVIAPLLDVLRGPQDSNMPEVFISCSVACDTLLALAVADRVHREAMVDGGVIGLLLALCADVWNARGTEFCEQKGEMAALLTRILIESGTAAARDLERAIRAPDPVQCFGALLLLQVRQPCLCPIGPLSNYATLLVSHWSFVR
jgi:hypothetical protein